MGLYHAVLRVCFIQSLPLNLFLTNVIISTISLSLILPLLLLVTAVNVVCALDCLQLLPPPVYFGAWYFPVELHVPSFLSL